MILKSQKEIVAAIHKDFDTAQDRLLQEAKALIEQTGCRIIDKAERLHKVGFVNNPLKKQRDMLVKTKEQAELIEYYKQTYPFQKFLTESELDRICTKYNLIYAPVERYTKDVPESNLRDIENSSPLFSNDIQETAFRITKVEGKKEYEQFKKAIGHEGDLFTNSQVLSIEKKYGMYEVEDWCFGKKDHMIFYSAKEATDCRFYIEEYETINKQGLFIAAPKSHFDLKGLKQKGLGMFNISIREVKDPIVFRYCRGGIQVITKWGLEAEDESLVNEKMN